MSEQDMMTVIRILLYMLLQMHKLECAKLPERQHVVFPELLESRGVNGGKILRITEELTLNLEKSAILSKNFLLRTYEDGIMKHTYHDGEILEEELYHDPKHLASVMVSEDDGLQVEGVLGPKLRIKPLVQDRKAEGRTAHVLYEIDDDTNHDNAHVGVEWRGQLNISGRDDVSGDVPVEARPELLVAVDSTFGSKFDTLIKLIKYIIVLINSVNVRYMNLRNPSVRLRLQALEVLDDNVEHFLYRVENVIAAYRSLQSFKLYVEDNPDKYGPYDAVFLVTGLDMAQYTGYYWDVELQGIAYVAGACTSRKVSIGEDRPNTYFGVRIFAHEFAHLLGCPHDGQQFGSYSSLHCSWYEGYLMSYRVEDSRSMKFSSCCQDNIRRFIGSAAGSCLLQQGSKRKIKKGNFTTDLPGEFVTEDNVCKCAFPEVADTYLIDDGRGPCQGRCYMPSYVRGVGFKTTVFPDNFKCKKDEKNGVCINGDCTEQKLKYAVYKPSK
uniref:Putative tick salivary metalloprotease n=1 Tax=Rhipicephalus pulchellus TaxID=72859 RepID=L7LTI2_RHIPC